MNRWLKKITTNKTFGFGRQMLLLLTLFCLIGGSLMLTGAGAHDDDDDDDERGACAMTTAAALSACQNEKQDDYWIAVGNCNNLSDGKARATCLKEARNALSEGKQLCRDQRKARQEVCRAVGEAPYDPAINPAMFINPAEIGKSITPNPYFPLVRGRRLTYRSGTETINVEVTEETRVIQGVTCAVITDLVEENGETIEDTIDWYAQDIHGNVWYFGELAENYVDGQLNNLAGSWTAGVDGAKAGIIIRAVPRIGEVYREEFSLGNAEDMAETLKLDGSATVPATACNGDCLVTKNFTPTEPGKFDHKYYARGIGVILGINPETGKRTELIRIRR